MNINGTDLSGLLFEVEQISQCSLALVQDFENAKLAMMRAVADDEPGAGELVEAVSNERARLIVMATDWRLACERSLGEFVDGAGLGTACGSPRWLIAEEAHVLHSALSDIRGSIELLNSVDF